MNNKKKSVDVCKNDHRKKVVEDALSNVGSLKWSKFAKRTSFDGKVVFIYTEFKCNLFVYEMLQKNGVKQDLPNKAGKRASLFLSKKNNGRPYTASQWYDKKVPRMTFIGEGLEGLKASCPGDIITDGHHMGIIVGTDKTVSASSRISDLMQVVSNNWGWRKENYTGKKPVRIFRYN